ncbi:Ger(x)C family spore germination protein [Aneurinibacillus thermoaerophilus]|uniref:Ger(x)C family spore germination protein n=1 Tax=Aneurinibacillus thermoaerophilus TaxID=143495 RepID=UPI002E21019F|nr:Ger(x)C family spore germination protein [Aneurinibacillus thermoaerophilus]MED0737533.1 Ger(x)C family spore germination protein [Aneurinibacillus thermoaerophilus]MED0758104.1 Ger(x)C family spore germination protein [Aneurinibacillus thermoaerophilus]MED0761258.1 Ger(x)C family spore germination protein [Aneurinibacillus thermoaerophilus]MED0762860.1 Ger(x)C family spore germination protein [Aneurinibacillus thermoaerophilus]
MKKTKRTFMFSLLLSLIMITGCWDRIELEDIGLVLGVAIDESATKAAKKQEKEELKGQAKERKHILMAHHFIIPQEVSGKTSIAKRKPYSNVINEGETIFEIVRELSTRVARPPNYEHLKVIVISEEIARSTDLRDIINFFLRNPESRRTIKMLIAKGKARETFEKRPSIMVDPALEMAKMIENTKKTLRMAPEMTLGDMSEKLTSETSFVMQRVVTSKTGTKVAGATVINGKTHKMVGWLGEDEMEGLNWMSGKGKAGIVKGTDQKTGKTMVYEVGKMRSRIKPKVQGNNISFTVDIETEGSLREDWLEPGNAFKENLIKRAEKAAEMEIKRLTQKALTKTQKKFKVDVAGFGKQLSIYYPKVWKEVKKDWDKHFSKIPVDINVKVQISEFGTRGTKM